jgi:hypothetical protein
LEILEKLYRYSSTYRKSIYQISSWANLVTAHFLLGKDVLEDFKAGEAKRERCFSVG